jgi:hypothetical protein
VLRKEFSAKEIERERERERAYHMCTRISSVYVLPETERTEVSPRPENKKKVRVLILSHRPHVPLSQIQKT